MKKLRRSLLVMVAIILTLVIVAVALYRKSMVQPAVDPILQPTYELTPLVPNPNPNGTSLRDTNAFLDQLILWAPDIRWQIPIPSIRDVDGELVSGVSVSGGGISPNTVAPGAHSGIHGDLVRQGWLYVRAADGPGGSMHEYAIDVEGGKKRVIYLEYKTKTPIISTPGEPVEFAECPCPYELTVFYSDPY